MTIQGAGRYDGEQALLVENCGNLLIKGCDIGKSKFGVQFANSLRCSLSYNHIHEGCSGGVRLMKGAKDCLIEGNHIHDYYDPGGVAHGTGISIRAIGNVVIRNNIVHDGFSSTGLRLYNDIISADYHSNILFENNLVYDIQNMYVMWLNDVGENVVVRNNTFIGHNYRVVGEVWHLETALYVKSFAPGYSQGGLSVYNNIFAGIYASTFPGTKTGNNIIWSYNPGNYAFTCTPPDPGSKVVTCSNAKPPNTSYFSSGFFTGTPDFSENHRKTIEYSLAAGSPAINFGDASNQPSTSLGTLGPDGFIIDNGPARDASHHSAGAYEFGAAGVSNSQLSTVNVQHPTGKIQQGIHDLSGKRVPENTRKTGLYLVKEGERLSKVMVLE